MPWWLHTAAGLVVVGAFGAAAWRLAGALGGPRPIPRGLATAVLLWLGIQLAALATAIPGAPGIAPTGAAVAVVLTGLVWRLAPATPTAGLDGSERRMLLVVGVAVGLLAILGTTQPAIGFDGLLYHLALPAAWAGDGQLASLPTVARGLPVEAYPVGVEIVVGWLVSVTGATVTSMLIAPLALGVTTVSVWTLVRRLGGGETAAWGAVATSVAALPFLSQGASIATDLPAAALMGAGAALVVGAATLRRGAGAGPEAVAPSAAAPTSSGAAPSGAASSSATPSDPASSVAATTASARPARAEVTRGATPSPVVAGLLLGLVGLLLALGIKTSAACGGLLFLIFAWPARRELVAELRARPWWLLLLGLAAACGLVWLARNLVLHGNPAWPLLSSPGGDPVPPSLKPFGERFIDHPRFMLRLGGTGYLQLAWPIPPLLLASLIALVRGSAVLRATAVCGLLGAAAWTVAPVTGVSFDKDLAVGATRYLMPCWVLLAVAGWAAIDRLPRPAVLLAAAAATIAQVVLASGYATDLEPLDGVPIEHGATVLRVVAALGLLALIVAVAVRRRPSLVADLRARLPARPAGVTPARLGVPAAVVVVALVLAATPGFWTRHAETIDSTAPPDLDDVVLATGAVPAFSLGPYGRPGGRVVAGCPELQAGLAAGRTVAISPAAPPCPLTGDSVFVDGFRVYGPGVR